MLLSILVSSFTFLATQTFKKIQLILTFKSKSNSKIFSNAKLRIKRMEEHQNHTTKLYLCFIFINFLKPETLAKKQYYVCKIYNSIRHNIYSTLSNILSNTYTNLYINNNNTLKINHKF